MSWRATRRQTGSLIDVFEGNTQTDRKFDRCLGGKNSDRQKLLYMSWEDTQTDRKFDICLGRTRRQIGSLIDAVEGNTQTDRKCDRCLGREHADRQEV